MRGERASLGSLSGALNYEHGSTSSNAVIDQQICQENSHGLGENELQDYIISPNGTNISFANSIYHEQRDLHRFSLDEASSSGTKGEVPSQDEQGAEHGSFEEQRNDSIDLNPLFVQSSSSYQAVQSINLNTEYIENPEDVTQVMGYPGQFEANGPGNEQVPPGRPFEENSGRAGSSFEGCRASCKRKALECSIGQSSLTRGCRDFHYGESSSWAIGPAFPGNGLNIPVSLDQGPRGLAPRGIPNFPVPVIAENSHRNFRVRINPSDQQVPMNSAVFSAESVVRQPAASSLPNSSRLLPVDQQPLDSRHGHGLGDVVTQYSNAPAIRVAPISRNVPPPFHWSGGPVLGGSSSSVVSVDRNSVQRDETRPRRLSRNILVNPLFVPAPDLRNLACNQTNRSTIAGNINIAGNIVSSSSRTGSGSTGVHPSPSNSASIPPRQNNHSRYQRRISELVRRSLLSSLAVEPAANQSSGDHLALHSTVPPAPPDERVLQAGVGNSQAHNQTHTRAAPWLERHRDRMVGIPHSLRVLASASRGRNRLAASEIRNILDLMRRGENVQFEDLMLLDQSVLLGVADVHDRYRDMRLDVDNMSYEELLALEERIGNVCTGLSEETISNRLKQWTYKGSDGRSLQEAEPCCICQEEYREGESMGRLECGHDFHGECIKEWLKRKNLCPICKTTGLNTTEKPTG